MDAWLNNWLNKAKLPVPTLASFAVFAVLLWFNAVFNRYLFNVMLALLATVPLLYMLARGALKATRPDPS